MVFEHYGAPDVLAARAEALKENQKARELLRNGSDLVSQYPDRLEDTLIDPLRGPCAEMAEGGTPVLLVIDDLERILDADPGDGGHRVKPDNAPALGAVLRAFEATIHAGNSRLLITRRHPFRLDGLEERLLELQLPPLSEAAQRRLELRQKEAAADEGQRVRSLMNAQRCWHRSPTLRGAIQPTGRRAGVQCDQREGCVWRCPTPLRLVCNWFWGQEDAGHKPSNGRAAE